MKSIPKKLLIHSAELSTPDGSDIWQNVTYTEPIKLQHVRIEPCSKIIIGPDNVQRQHTATLFFDVVNSSPGNTEFVEGQRIQALGKTYIVLTVMPMYDERALHHYEVLLG